MALSQSELRVRAEQFSREWAFATRERAEAQTFWDDFFQIFGITRRRVATFEEPVKMLGDRRGSIDLLWPGVLIVEHKSEGEDLETVHTRRPLTISPAYRKASSLDSYLFQIFAASVCTTLKQEITRTSCFRS
jgi:hypothetical protein